MRSFTSLCGCQLTFTGRYSSVVEAGVVYAFEFWKGAIASGKYHGMSVQIRPIVWRIIKGWYCPSPTVTCDYVLKFIGVCALKCIWIFRSWYLESCFLLVVFPEVKNFSPKPTQLYNLWHHSSSLWYIRLYIPIYKDNVNILQYWTVLTDQCEWEVILICRRTFHTISCCNESVQELAGSQLGLMKRSLRKVFVSSNITEHSSVLTLLLPSPFPALQSDL